MMATLLPVSANAQTFDNDAVIALHRAGLGDAPVIAKIHAMPCHYDTSAAAMVSLKRAGLSDGVIVAMVESCATLRASGASQNPPAAGGADVSAHSSIMPWPHQEGIYWTGDRAHGEIRLRPAGQSAVKIVGNGSVLFPHRARLVVPRPVAQFAIASTRPIFRFQFNPQGQLVSEFGSLGGAAVQSPNDFSLVRFRQDGGTRQITIGRVAPYVSVSGIDPKNSLPFAVTDVGDGVFHVSLSSDLPPGEYGFVLAGEAERRKETVFRIYDFTITGSAAGAP